MNNCYNCVFKIKYTTVNEKYETDTKIKNGLAYQNITICQELS